MRTATYLRPDGTHLTVEYDPDAPCHVCGLPVVAASMAGTVVCPWCDLGQPRDGKPQWPYMHQRSGPLVCANCGRAGGYVERHGRVMCRACDWPLGDPIPDAPLCSICRRRHGPERTHAAE